METRPSIIQRLKEGARSLKAEVMALYYAMRDPRTPWYAKALAGFVVAHTLSPIDLIPDFIPVLGYLDDLIIAPGGIWLARRLIPAEVLADARRRAAQSTAAPGRWGMIGAALILIVWILAAAWVIRLLLGWAGRD